MKHLFLLFLCIPAFCAAAGCREPSMQTVASNAQKTKNYKNRKILTPKDFKRPPNNASSDELEIIARAYDATRSQTRTVGGAEDVAVKKVVTAIHASLELGPTLVVWIIDRTPSSQKIAIETIEAAKRFYDDDDVRQYSIGTEQRLLSTFVAYDEQVDFLIEKPTSDWQLAKKTLESIQPSAAGKEMTFTAIQQTIEKYLTFRTQERREMVLIVVTDEVGEDQNLLEGLIDTTRRNALPVYVIGSAAPWGQANPFAPNPKVAEKTKTDDSLPTHGPESRFSERVDISMALSSGYAFGARPNLELVDSGFGPFSLERLCRAGGGQFFAIRPEADSTYSYRGTQYVYWPTGSELRFDPQVVKKYTPDYVSESEYRRLLTENAARQALHNAAQLPPVSIDEVPDTQFPKVAEAQMKRSLDKAQQFAATHAPAVDKLYAALILGEADRDRLTGPRWQAQYDLAMGRASAIKVRIDGYNSMIAALKRGKEFSNASSKVWTLEPADAFETESSLRKLADRAKMYLERVVKEHPGTPWAKIAEEELKAPLGWTWKEA